MGSELPVIIETSLFWSVHNSRFNCTINELVFSNNFRHEEDILRAIFSLDGCETATLIIIQILMVKKFMYVLYAGIKKDNIISSVPLNYQFLEMIGHFKGLTVYAFYRWQEVCMVIPV